VWDFHGVLEEGTEKAALEISNRVLGDYGYAQRFTREDGDRLYGRKWYGYFEDLLPDEPHARHLALQEAAFVYDAAHPEIVARYIEPAQHALAVLDEIAKHHAQIVISNTRPEALGVFIAAVGMQRYFPGGRAFAVDTHKRDATRTKQHVLAEFLAENAMDEIVVIGDSAADMALAEVAGGIRYHYVHPGRPFKDCPADYRIHDLREVLSSI
jgi:phosphoglycolate phosphatase-like HAD superfamily hydrolase